MASIKRFLAKFLCGKMMRYLAERGQMREVLLDAGYWQGLFTNIWLREWREYFNSHDGLAQTVEQLCEGLDEESAWLLRRTWRLNCLTLPCDGEPDDYCLPTHLCSEGEIAAVRDFEQISRRIEHPEEYRIEGNIFEQSVLDYHCGLRELSSATRAYLAGRDFIDGGACWGDTALVMQKYAPACIHAFEPAAQNVATMRRILNINPCPCKVLPLHMGLAREPGLAKIAVGEGCPSFAPGQTASATYEEVAVTDLDSYASAGGLCVGLIKLDVEGMECDVVQGALRTIQQHRPVLLISLYHRPRDFFEILPLLRTSVNNYRWRIRKYNDRSLNQEIMLIGVPEEAC